MTALIETLSLGEGRKRVVVKDNIDIAGYPTRAGSAALVDAPPAQRHADIVERTLAAGYQIVGKANLHELAFGMTGVNKWTGTPENPNFPKLIPGGSSSGSAAAVAAGLADVGVGTDTGGSIRLPAACCGLYGLKPTFGRLDRRGVVPAVSSLDCVGVITANLEELTTFMAAVDDDFTPTPNAALPKLAWLEVEAEDFMQAAIEDCLAKASSPTARARLNLIDDAYRAGMVVISAETYRAFAGLIEGGHLGDDIARRLAAAGKITDAELAEAEKVRVAFTAEVDRLLESYDVLVLPTLPHTPLTRLAAEAGEQDLTISNLLRPFNLSGHPALTMPLQTHNGAPVAMQLVGRKGGDAVLCDAARILANANQRALR